MNMALVATKQIVIAWAEKTKLVPTGRHVMRDLNWFPEFRSEWEGRAAMWMQNGTDADLTKAKECATNDGRLVFVYPASEPEPLIRARADAVKATAQTAGEDGQ